MVLTLLGLGVLCATPTVEVLAPGEIPSWYLNTEEDIGEINVPLVLADDTLKALESLCDIWI